MLDTLSAHIYYTHHTKHTHYLTEYTHVQDY